jgi:hypothetical protein
VRTENHFYNPQQNPVRRGLNTQPSISGNLHPQPSPRQTIQNTKKKLEDELLDYEKDKHGVIESIKILKQELDAGLVSHVDFFKTYRMLQKDLFTLNNIIEKIKTSM